MKVLKLFYACLLIGTCMAFTSCDDNEEEASVKKVVGTWSVTEKYYSYKENGTLKEETTDTYQPGECTYTFHEDGTLSINWTDYTESGNWRIDGDMLLIELDGFEIENETVTVKEFSEKQIVLEITDTYTEEDTLCEDYDRITLKK